jgi:hypothetical protein
MDLSRYSKPGEVAATSSPEAPTAWLAARLKVVAVLRASFDLVALNLVLLAACLPIVTMPAAFQAAIVALERWRQGGENHVLREFVAVLRSGRSLRATLSVGVPFAAAAVAVEEVHFFLRGGTVVNSICLGLGVAAVLLSLASLGYILVLGARRPDLAAADLWSLSASLALRNLLWPSPLLVVEFAATAVLLLRDPLLALIGLPVALLGLVRLTADHGIRRAGRRASRQARGFA